MIAQPTGVLILQLGTPDSPGTSDVRKYLREFLSDPRVLDMPALARSLLLNAVILPFRPKKSAHAYQQIWTDEGSPLVIHTQGLSAKVAARLGDAYRVAIGMRYQNPSIEAAIESLVNEGCDRIVVFPLFPQYASASGGSAVARTLELLSRRWNVIDVSTIGAFYADPGYLEAVGEVSKMWLDEFQPEHVLFSYHGLPEQHVRKSDDSRNWCLTSDSCCDTIGAGNRFCYRAQCYATTRGLVSELGLEDGTYSTAFQSRLAGQKWIEPYTDHVLPKLHDRGVRRLAVLTPSFASDCLETLEEIGIRGRNQWLELGGTDMLLVPCVNDSDLWSSRVAEMVRGHSTVMPGPEPDRP